MTEVPEHDATDPLERDVAHDETATVQERREMLAALRRLRARTARDQRTRTGVTDA